MFLEWHVSIDKRKFKWENGSGEEENDIARSVVA